MTFAVVWSHEAFSTIAKLAKNPEGVVRLVRAIRQIDSELSIDPGTKGESRPSGQRIFFASPLGVLFEIHWRTNEVVVGRVWTFE